MAREEFPQLGPHSNVVVVGTSGSGKTTLAKSLCEKFGLEEVELDALFWEPNWTEAEQPIFRDRIDSKTSKQGWAVSGNYSKVRDLTWKRADVIIWLDYSRTTVMWRVIRRTINRVLNSETLWGGNKETFYKSFLSRDSIILWAWTSHKRNKDRYEVDIKSGEFSNAEFVRLKTPTECEEFLNRQ